MSGVLDEDSARKRQLRRALLSAAVVVVLGWWISGYVYRDQGPAIATVERLEGVLIASNRLIGRWDDLTLHHSVLAGQELQAGPNSRAALDLGPSFSLRLDRGTRLTLHDARSITLKHGAVYADSRDANRVEIRTPHITVAHTSTQYEVRVLPDATRVSVRVGAAEIRTNRGETFRAGAGDQLTVSAKGEIQRETIARADKSWAWAVGIAPTFRVEGRTLANFLAWVERESGTAVTFDSPVSEAEARTLVLRGSIDGLSPVEALEHVLPSTPLQARRTSTGIVIGFAEVPSSP